MSRQATLTALLASTLAHLPPDLAEAVRGALAEASPAPAKPKAPAKMTAADVRSAIWVARRAAYQEFGPRWAIYLDAQWAPIPGRIADYEVVGGDGCKAKMRGPRNFPIPPAEYWPGGVIPADVELPIPDTQASILRRQKQRDHAKALAKRPFDNPLLNAVRRWGPHSAPL